MTEGAADGEPIPARTSATTAGDSRATVIFLGTSLTAGYGLAPEQAFPALVEAKAARAGVPMRAINAGVSGETSAGALRRIDWVLETPADVIVIETGANDALRALSVEAARSNIGKIVARVKEKRPAMRIVLVEMLAPPNFGPAYTRPFKAIYSDIAEREDVVLAPFMLDGVAGYPERNQADGVHPNAAGAAVVAANMWRALEPVLKSLPTRR